MLDDAVVDVAQEEYAQDIMRFVVPASSLRFTAVPVGAVDPVEIENSQSEVPAVAVEAKLRA